MIITYILQLCLEKAIIEWILSLPEAYDTNTTIPQIRYDTRSITIEKTIILVNLSLGEMILAMVANRVEEASTKLAALLRQLIQGNVLR